MEIYKPNASKIEANEYRDYIVGFIFYKYLCDKEEQFALKESFAQEDLINLTKEDTETVEYFKENIGFFISYKNLFSTWVKLGRDFDMKGLKSLSRAFGA